MYQVVEEMQHLWATEAQCFDAILSAEGEIFREFANRRTLRTKLGEKICFIKVHQGVGWREIFKNLLTLRAPVLGASNEWRALKRLSDMHIPTPTPLVFASRGRNPASRCSFIVTEALEGMVSLEDYCADWRASPPPLAVFRKVLRSVAVTSRRLHAAGINHRDFYICHFLFDPKTLADEPRLFLIDLHRAQIRRSVPRRWLVKDLGGLLFSALDINLTRRDLLRFVRIYTGVPLRHTLTEDRMFWLQVVRRASRLYLQDHPAVPGWLSDLERKLR